VPNAASVGWWWRSCVRDVAGRPIGRAALIRDHQRAGFLTLGHGYLGRARVWRRRLAPSVYYLGARVDLTRRRAPET